MCKVKVRVNKNNASFVIYNHLYSRKANRFSVEILRSELKQQYGLDLNQSEIQTELDGFIDSGLVMHSLDKYKVCMN